MKKLKYVFYLLLITTVTSCSCGCAKQNTSKSTRNNIKGLESCVVDGYRYTIIEVYGEQYLANSSGGIIKLEKK